MRELVINYLFINISIPLVELKEMADAKLLELYDEIHESQAEKRYFRLFGSH